MAAYLEFPFTNAQWNELHRQAMIYKYMMASVPVPPGLLFLDPAASCPPWLVRGGTDAEPGRCRRTDGKKWRCSRDAAPDKKYCERHMNRGRPRSRKPVELHVADRTNKKHRHAAHNDLHKAVAAFGSAATSPPHQESRSLNWMMKEPIFMDTADQEWQHMIKLKIGSPEIPFSNISTSVLHQDFRAEDHQTPNNCTHFVANEDERTKCNYLNLDMVSTDTPRGFIDAWSSSVSNDQNIVTANISNETIPLSSLTLSMGGCNSLEDEMGLNVHTAEDKERNGTKLDFSGWLSTTPGGPLAEVLRPHSSSVSNGVSNSSPSGGVVQNASLVSFSDSSQASSPTTLESSSHARTRAAMH